jgi:DNA-binding response OmpR family regulator
MVSVLCVEDDEETQDDCRTLLNEQGADATIVDTLKEFKQKLEEGAWQLYIVD